MTQPTPATFPISRQRTAARRLAAALGLTCCLLLAACSSPPQLTATAHTVADETSPWAAATRLDPAGGPSYWQHKTFAGREPTEYKPVWHAGRPALRAHSHGGNSMLRSDLRMAPPALGRLSFSWFTQSLLTDAIAGVRGQDDASMRVVLSFDGNRDRLSARDHLLSELSMLVAGEPLPYATLMYIWDPKLPVGTIVSNPHTDRIRMMVIESGADRLGQWVDHVRDVRQDYRMAFGEAPGPLIGVGLVTDTNKTGETVEAWYGPLRWLP